MMVHLCVHLLRALFRPPWKKAAHHVASETLQYDFDSASNWERLRAELDTFDEDISAPDDPNAGVELMHRF